MENLDTTNIVVSQQPESVNDYELARQVGIFHSNDIFISIIILNIVCWDAEADSRE